MTWIFCAIVGTLYAVGNSLIQKFHMCTTQVKIKLFKTYCCSAYTSQLWYKYRQSSLDKARVAYNTILRRLLGIPRYENGQNYSASAMFANNSVCSFPALIRKLIFRFRERLISFSEYVFNFICKSSFSVVSKLWVHWKEMLQSPSFSL